ncbi:MAG: ABC transporter permease [Rhizobiales bacterium]|nr:ABC transporter permease [Hyphomicrobiales bacterium]MBI3673015.1 ABC transporter permease [Hyphomicrobiales bacterium]
MAAPRSELPAWVDIGLIPLLNLAVALIVAGLVVVIIGENPLQALGIMLNGALGSFKGWSYLFYYTTNFTFTGLAVAVAFHAGLFNIGGEGQAYFAGLGAAIVGLNLEFLPWPIVIPLAVLASAGFGAFWAWVPGVLQAKRGSHIVITTIMFNFIAASLMVYLINNVFRPVGRMAVESREITGAYILNFRELGRLIGWKLPSTPLNPTIFLAFLAAWGVWYLLWRTKLGYEIRTVGANPEAAAYAGIDQARIITVSMAISGALAGLLSVNEVLGVQHRLLLEFAGGAGFVGIAVALMGRSHPVGIVLAAMLFGLLYQGGTELSFARPLISRDMIVVIQGLVILFMGALEYAFRPWMAALFFKPED